ncbi:translation initiation factor IF-2 [Maritalea porphyrae]|jgi:translation initiation factor IF-2|uniref:translation initiation factor IF-2 n=1 Tax=Maritalea porphyrae TaxID=880732 RepID=UPI0022AF5D81|nr:translation initiation factor IF-2 [Maritalea porphyrae]MCZ4272177.1 translation initiation factor IF-2 [Maritalea porphyrae]
MSDNDKRSDATPGDGDKKTLSLKGGPAGGGRPGGGRSSRTVVVEKRSRTFTAPSSGAAPRPKASEGGTAGRPTGQRQQPRRQDGNRNNRPGQGGRRQEPANTGLTNSESEKRERALRAAAARADEERRAQVEAEQRRIDEAAQRKADREAAERAEAAEAARLEAERLERQREEAEAAKAKTAKPAKAKTKPAPKADPVAAEPPAPPTERAISKNPDQLARKKPLVREDELERAKRAAKPQPSKKATTDDRRQTRLTVTTATRGDSERDRGHSLAAMKRRRAKQRGKGPQTPKEKISREVTIPEAITVQELSIRMAERAVDVIKFMMSQDQMVTINDVLDADTAELIATELGHTVKRVAEADVETGVFDDEAARNPEDLAPRAPVVTIMGHVDHGKTSLLDAIREANVVSGEAGGITQHIGAYQVERDGHNITFLDTPGHEAFTAMRARGAQATDIAILVVAADDGVMPQTIESIKHAKAAGVPIIVAINKMDKHEADPSRVRNELLQHEVFVETMGGDILDVEVSAMKKQNLEGILDAIVLQSEILELKANPKGRAQGIVIEAKLDKGRGAVATVLVQNGELAVGDIVVAGSQWAKVRALINDKGEQVKTAGPSIPVEVLGFAGVPEAGDLIGVVEHEARAREITEYRQRAKREKSAGGGVTSLEQMMNQLKTEDLAKIPLVIKGDVQGSVEAIIGALEKLGTDEVSAQVLIGGVGGITESDVTLAAASNAVVFGFNTRANKQAREAAAREGVEIRYYNIIYDLVDDVKAAMSGLLAPEVRETFLGNAKILEVFNITKVGRVAGCQVTDGMVERGAGVRLIRDDVVIHEGKLSTLKRFKDEVKDVHSGQECGMAFEKYEDMRAGDVIECYRVEEIERTL